VSLSRAPLSVTGCKSLLEKNKMKRLFARTFSCLVALFALSVVVLPADALPHSSLPPSLFSGNSNSLDPSKFLFQEIASGFAQPLFITHAGDGSGRMFIVERAGQIKIVNNGVVLAVPFLDIHTLVKSTSSEQGLLALAFHPSYETNGNFYVVYTAPRNGDAGGSNLVLEKFSVSANPDLADPGSGIILLTISHPTNSNHNGGTLAFGQDGYLYWSTGDGGGGGDPDNNGQNLNFLLGKILRLDVDSSAPYIPNDNPFYNNPNPSIRKEIWAYGLRNPWRFSFDRLTNDMYIGDVGQSKREEINFQPAISSGGENYGWRVMEGSLCYNPTSGCDITGKILPIAEYDHSVGCSITGGYVYRGTTYPTLAGYYFFGDYCTGRVFSLYKDVNSVWVKTQIADLPYNISTFGEDEQGNLYLSNLSSGQIYQIQYPSTVLVTSITRTNSNPTKAASVDFTVTFSETVTGVDLSDFSLTTTGVSGATLNGVSGSDNTYTVTVNTGSGNGTIGLGLVDDDSILGAALNPIGGSGAGNGNFDSGEVYTMDYIPPTILSIVRVKANPNASTDVKFRVTFSEPVSGIDPSDFSLNTAGVVGATVSSVSMSGSGMMRIVTVNTGMGDGTIRLDAIDNDTITDLASNPLNGGFTSGELYTIEKPDLPAPNLRSPRANTITNNTLPTFWWTTVRGGAAYEIDFASDSAFTNLVNSEIVNGSPYTITSPLSDGKYFWRVRAHDIINQPGTWSSARTFTIDTTGPTVPVLSAPANNASTRRTPAFKWLSVPTAVAYEFQYDNNADFSSPTYSVTARSTFRRPPAMKIGTYYWHVRAKDASGNWGGWSVTSIVNITNP